LRSTLAVEPDAIEFHPVIDEAIAQLFGYLLLQSFKLWIDEFDDLAGLNVDEMIVMRLGSGFITRAAVSEIMPVENAGFFEQADRAVDRRNRNAWIDLVRAVMNHFNIGMVIGFGQNPRNHAPLFSNPQALVGAELFEIDTLVQFGFLNE
jgi:hypothetical protein